MAHLEGHAAGVPGNPVLIFFQPHNIHRAFSVIGLSKNPKPVKKPFLLFTLKCTVILYFAACTGINSYTSSLAASPYVTKGTWKVKLLTSNNNDETVQLNGYDLTFSATGKITAQKNNEVITGNWSENEIEKTINISFDTRNPALEKLNNNWDISTASDNSVQLKDDEHSPGGRLQITSL